MKMNLPKGVRDFDFRESFIIDQIEKNIEDNFKLWGYEKLQFPLLEYYDIHSRSLTKTLLNSSFRIVDRYEGSILILRPDFTAQVARYVSCLKDYDFPIRLYYKGDIFRYVIPKGDNLYERRQIGIELIGVSEIEADAEVIGVAVSCLLKLGIEGFQIDINSIKIFTAIKNLLNLDEDEFITFMGYIRNREIYKLKAFISKFSIAEELKSFILSIPRLKGDISLIKEIAQKVENFSQLREAFEDLLKIHKILSDYNLDRYIFFDLGEPKEFDYYTGIVFEIFSKEFKSVIGAGGRYDNLISNYGKNIPATGFAFDTFFLFDILKTKTELQEKKDFYIIDTTDDKKIAYFLSSKLREKGYSVARDIIKRDAEISKQIAFKKGYKNVVIIKLENSEKKLYIYSSDGQVQIKNIEDILG